MCRHIARQRASRGWMVLGGALLTGLLACGCARGPVSPSEATGFCMSYEEGGGNGDNSGGGDCGLKNEYCWALRDSMDQQYETQDACLAACREVGQRNWALPQALGCGQTFANGRLWCERHCRTSYPDAQ